MTQSEQNSFRNVLEYRQTQLGDGYRRETLAVEAVPDDLDRIQQASDHDFVVSSLQRNASQLGQVQDALYRIGQGTFGICVECEDPINPKRLAAVPWAAFCIVCQEAADLGETSRSRTGADLVMMPMWLTTASSPIRNAD
jgi:DnaK suppressor protein